MFSILRPYIFSLDPEVAHVLAIKSLKANILPKSFFKVRDEEMLETTLFGNNISNPIGLAAGFDKSAEVYNSLFKFGFGFIEVGTVTPKQQFYLQAYTKHFLFSYSQLKYTPNQN